MGIGWGRGAGILQQIVQTHLLNAVSDDRLNQLQSYPLTVGLSNIHRLGGNGVARMLGFQAGDSEVARRKEEMDSGVIAR